MSNEGGEGLGRKLRVIVGVDVGLLYWTPVTQRRRTPCQRGVWRRQRAVVRTGRTHQSPTRGASPDEDTSSRSVTVADLISPNMPPFMRTAVSCALVTGGDLGGELR